MLNPLLLVSLLLLPANLMPTPLENLPTGQYLYHAVSANGTVERGSILLRKVGHTVVGLDQRPRAGNACFRGIVEGDRITQATRIYPPYQPDSRWEHQSGDLVDLSQYRSVESALTPSQVAALHTCLVFFSH